MFRKMLCLLVIAMMLAVGCSAAFALPNPAVWPVPVIGPGTPPAAPVVLPVTVTVPTVVVTPLVVTVPVPRVVPVSVPVTPPTAWPYYYTPVVTPFSPPSVPVITYTPVTRYSVPTYSPLYGLGIGAGYRCWLTAANGKNVNVRQQPGKQYARIGSFPVGTPVTVLGTMGEWSLVQVEGVQGYVMSQFIASAPIWYGR